MTKSAKRYGGATGVSGTNGQPSTTATFFDKMGGTSGEDRLFQKCVFKYSAMTLVLVAVCSLILNIIRNPGSASRNVEHYFFILAFPLIMMFALLLNVENSQNARTTFFKIATVMTILGGLTYYYSQSTGETFAFTAYTNYGILILIVLVALGLAYNMLIRYMSRLTGWPGFIAQLIFYIPCIFWDLWLYIFKQFQMTPAAIYAFILLEIFLIVIYICLPGISNSITGLKDGTQLLSNVYFLDKGPKIIATSDILRVPPTTTGSSESQFRTNYCISMWVFVNPQNPSQTAYSKETEILSYGYTDGSGVQHVKPMIRYYGGGDGTDQLIERDKYVFYFSRYPPIEQYDSSGDTFYDVHIPNQKWNQIVLNYNRNIVDLFINGVLERSFSMQNTLPTYSDLDNITVGSVDGLRGAICNVAYYNHPLSSDQITFSYNTMMGSNPPVPKSRNSTTPQPT